MLFACMVQKRVPIEASSHWSRKLWFLDNPSYEGRGARVESTCYEIQLTDRVMTVYMYSMIIYRAGGGIH